ncbi:MAG: DNA repair exonuclease [Proteobacteria bacterium]|nr:DNA repair exonuclease [Pseudomonadota bacterium]
MTGVEEQDVALKLLHTADWHLGKRFPSFDELDQKLLTRARLEVIDSILGQAQRHTVHAVLCAGDLFEDPDPGREWWEGLARRFSTVADWPETRPVFLLPGNHDPLTRKSVYWPEHPFRRALPPWVHVVDRAGFEYPLSAEAVVYAEPCQSAAGQDDLALALPDREPGDERIRIGLVHGQTTDIPGHQSNFPIARDAAQRRGLDYLAIGDTHSYRRVSPDAHVPVVYPGAPEATAFDESDAGHVVVVFFRRGRRRPHIKPIRVGRWQWEEHVCRDLDALRQLAARQDLKQRVVRLHLDLDATLGEKAEIDRLERELKGTDASPGQVGVLVVERDIRLDTSDDNWLDGLPDILVSVVKRLKAIERDDPDTARRALAHLHTLVRSRSGAPAVTSRKRT